MKLAVAAALVAVPVTARAEVSRCASADADLTYAATDLQQLSGDTGWFPNGYAAQLRIAGRVTGQTTVAMGLSPTACWGDAMTLTAPGREQTGLLDSEYGAELHVYAQIHTSVLGIAINWQGEIPLPYVPSDLLLAGTTTFDPVALPGSSQPVVSVSDVTGKVRVISTDVLSEIISVGGISGGLSLYVQGQMATSYATQSIQLGDGAITSATGSVVAAPPAAGFGATLDAPMYATGTVTYAPSLVFDVAFDVRIFGITVVNYQLASVTLPLAPIDRPVSLTGTGVSLALPHLANVPSTLGFASGATQTLQLHNAGNAPLALEITSAPGGVSAAAVTIAPGADGTLSVRAADPTAVGGALVLATNDPNHPTLSVTLDPAATGQVDEPPAGSGGPDAPQHGGCSTGGTASLLPLVAVVGLLRRRRRSVR